MPDSTAREFSAALRSATQSQSSLTGYAAFDSLSKAHALQSIEASPETPLTRALFTLKFPLDAQIPMLAAAYALLPGVAVAEPNYLLHIASGEALADSVCPLLSTKPAQIPLNPSALAEETQPALLLQLSFSDALLRAFRTAVQRDTTYTGIASFDSLGRAMPVTRLSLRGSCEGVDGKSIELLLHFPDGVDMEDAARRFLSLPYVTRAAPNHETTPNDTAK